MIDKLGWDSKFFGRKIGRLTKVPPKNKLKSLIQQAHKRGYEYLSCRLILAKIVEIQLLEKYGFYLTDVGVVWEIKLSSQFTVHSSRFTIREATAKDAPMLGLMVKGLYKTSRFYNDPFFTKKEADRLYQSWLKNSLQDKTIKVLIAGKSGFITCKILSKAKGDIPLVGVVKEVQGKGIGTSLMHRALKWFEEKGIKTVTVRTQANNLSAMDFYNGLGFMIKHVDATMGLILNHDA